MPLATVLMLLRAACRFFKKTSDCYKVARKAIRPSPAVTTACDFCLQGCTAVFKELSLKSMKRKERKLFASFLTAGDCHGAHLSNRDHTIKSDKHTHTPPADSLLTPSRSLIILVLAAAPPKQSPHIVTVQ